MLSIQYFTSILLSAYIIQHSIIYPCVVQLLAPAENALCFPCVQTLANQTAHKHSLLQSKVRKGLISVGQEYSFPICFTRVQNKPKLKTYGGTGLNLGHWNQWRFCGKLSIIHVFFQCWLYRKTFLRKHCQHFPQFLQPQSGEGGCRPIALGKILLSLCFLFQLVGAMSVPAAVRGIDKDEI